MRDWYMPRSSRELSGRGVLRKIATKACHVPIYQLYGYHYVNHRVPRCLIDEKLREPVLEAFLSSI